MIISRDKWRAYCGFLSLRLSRFIYLIIFYHCFYLLYIKYHLKLCEISTKDKLRMIRIVNDFIGDNGIFPQWISIIAPDFSMLLKDVAVIQITSLQQKRAMRQWSVRHMQRLLLSELRQMFTNSFHLERYVVLRVSLRKTNGTNLRTTRV